MGLNITGKILSSHLVKGSLEAGKAIEIRIDQTLTQDATGTMAYLQFEAIGLDRVRNELAVSYVDHNTVQVGFENADDHRYLQSGMPTITGICSQLHRQRVLCFQEPETASAIRFIWNASQFRERLCLVLTAIHPHAEALEWPQ